MRPRPRAGVRHQRQDVQHLVRPPPGLLPGGGPRAQGAAPRAVQLEQGVRGVRRRPQRWPPDLRLQRAVVPQPLPPEEGGVSGGAAAGGGSSLSVRRSRRIASPPKGNTITLPDYFYCHQYISLENQHGPILATVSSPLPSVLSKQPSFLRAHTEGKVLPSEAQTGKRPTGQGRWQLGGEEAPTKFITMINIRYN